MVEHVETEDNSKKKIRIKAVKGKVLGHHVPLEQLQYALGLILQVSGILLEGWEIILPKNIPLFCVLIPLVEIII